MGWSVGYKNDRWIGYGVPAICDQPKCGESIDRGLGYLCGDFSGNKGCGLFFCADHLFISESDEIPQLCEQCKNKKPPFKPTPDTSEWIAHMLNDSSWEKWRKKNKNQVLVMIAENTTKEN